MESHLSILHGSAHRQTGGLMVTWQEAREGKIKDKALMETYGREAEREREETFASALGTKPPLYRVLCCA